MPTACPSQSERSTGSRFERQRPRAHPSSSWEPTARPTREKPRNRAADAPASSTLPSPSKATPVSSKREDGSIILKPSRRSTAHVFMGFRSTRAPSRSVEPTSRSRTSSTTSCRSTPAKACAGALPARSAPSAGSSDHRAEMVFEALVAFACAPLEAFAVSDPDHAAAARDQIGVEKLADNGVYGRSLDPEQPGERFLRQHEPIASAVLRVQQPASSALRNGMIGVASHRLRDLRQKIIREAAEDVTAAGRLALRFLQRL